MRRIRQIAFGYSTKCNIKCAHCIATENNVKNLKMELKTAKEVVEEMAYHRVSGISFTAGEPFLFLDDLGELIELCNKHGIFTRVVTNGFWAKTQKDADQVLSKLQKKGLSQLRVSFSRWHQEHIDKSRILNATASCKKLGIDYFVSFITNFSGKDDKNEQFLRDNQITFFPEPIIYFGRARTFKSKPIFTDYTPNTCMMNPYFSPELNMNACCDAGLHFTKTNFFHVGNLKNNNIDQLFHKKENNPIYELIRTTGLTKIASHIGFTASTVVKYRKCELCEQLFNSSENLSKIKEATQNGIFSEPP